MSRKPPPSPKRTPARKPPRESPPPVKQRAAVASAKPAQRAPRKPPPPPPPPKGGGGDKSRKPTPPPVAKRPPHRPPYVATNQVRGNVAAMVIAGIDQPTIAQCVRITEKTLRRHYRRELDTSYAVVLTQVAGGLVAKARGGDVKAQIFYLETHGWVRSERLVVADGGIDDSDVTSLTDEQIERRITQLELEGRKGARRAR